MGSWRDGRARTLATRCRPDMPVSRRGPQRAKGAAKRGSVPALEPPRRLGSNSNLPSNLPFIESRAWVPICLGPPVVVLRTASPAVPPSGMGQHGGEAGKKVQPEIARRPGWFRNLPAGPRSQCGVSPGRGHEPPKLEADGATQGRESSTGPGRFPGGGGTGHLGGLVTLRIAWRLWRPVRQTAVPGIESDFLARSLKAAEPSTMARGSVRRYPGVRRPAGEQGGRFPAGSRGPTAPSAAPAR